jgi:integrase
MPRTKSRLQARSNRASLPARWKPHWESIAPGLAIGYRKNATGTGSWSVRVANGKGGNWIKRIGDADDVDGVGIAYADAVRKAHEMHGPAAANADKPLTVALALDAYAADLTARGGGLGNVTWVTFHLSATIGSKLVAQLNARELRHWRDGLLAKGLAPASVTRVCKSLSAALALAAAHDPRIKNRDAWRVGLKALPDAGKARNVILDDNAVRKIVAAAYAVDAALGVLVELCATTGCRPVQARRLAVGDVQKNRLMMPSSLKGKGSRRIERRPVPVPESLAMRLKQLGKGRDPDAVLLLRGDGKPWVHNSHRDPVRQAVKRAGLDPDRVTIYALRHSSIVRQLLKGVPIRLVAVGHDTSVGMIERTYSKDIASHGDDVVRATLLDLSEPVRGNVVAMR